MESLVKRTETPANARLDGAARCARSNALIAIAVVMAGATLRGVFRAMILVYAMQIG